MYELGLGLFESPKKIHVYKERSVEIIMNINPEQTEEKTKKLSEWESAGRPYNKYLADPSWCRCIKMKYAGGGQLARE